MSGPNRDRSNEASEIRRRELRSAGKCIDCEQPSKTQRCATCRLRVEEATARDRGKGVRGPLTTLANDRLDLRYALTAISAAHEGIERVIRRGAELNNRERAQLLREPISQANLARRFLVEVLERHAPMADPDENRAISTGAAGSVMGRS